MQIPFLKIQNNKLIFTAVSYMEIYIPDKLFKKDMNEYAGDVVNIFGIFNLRIGNSKGEIDPSSKLYTFNVPAMFTTKPSSSEIKEMELMKDTGLTKYHVLKYYLGDEVMTSVSIIKDISNVSKFIDLLLAGGLPRTIAYEDILKIFLKNMEINGQTGNVSAVIYSVIISELYRWKQDTSVPFRKIIGAGKNDNQYDYIPSNARNVCANNSTYSALTFEDADTMVVYSVNRKRQNKKQNKSPLEKIIEV